MDRTIRPLRADEATTLRAFRDDQRHAFRWRCSGLDPVLERRNGHADLIRRSIDGQTGQ